MKNSIKTNFSLLIGLIVISIMAGCDSGKNAENLTTNTGSDSDYITISQEQFRASSMQLTMLDSINFSDKLSVNGQLDVPPEYKAAVSAYYGGYVKNISILPGQEVRKGGVLFTMENPDFISMQQAFLESDGHLAFLKNDYERQKSLLADKVSAEKEYLLAEASYKAALAKRASLKKQLALINIDAEKLTADNMRSIINITSPIKGYVTKVIAEKGMYLAPKDVAVTITNSDHIHIELNAYEKDYSKLHIGQDISFRLQDRPELIYEASIYLISRSMDKEHRVIGIHGHLKDESLEKELIPGMYVEAEILSNTAKKLALPEEAIVNSEDKYYVLKLVTKSDSTYQFAAIAVNVGETQNGYINIQNTKDFKKGTQFLSKGAFNLISE